MNVLFRHIVFASLLVPALAHAEDAAPAATPEPAPKKIQLSAGLFYGMPQGDFKETGGMDLVGNSPGLVLSGGYQVIPHLSVLATIHYFKVSSEIDGVDLSMWDIGAGARYAYPVSPVLSAYGEGYVNRVSYSQDAGGASADASGIGFALGGGVLYAFKPNVSFGGGLTYSSAELDPDQGDKVSSGWLSLNAFAMYSL
jgi:hypothetical protein